MEQLNPDAGDGGLRTVGSALISPLPVECVLCYVWRMLDVFGCNTTLRWASRWRDIRAPRATSLEHRLGRLGGFCDCEIFLNGWVPVSSRRAAAGGAPAPAPRSVGLCAGVRRGSSQPCALWVPKMGGTGSRRSASE